MSCNGCRVLRKACPPNCTLRTSLQWIGVGEAQGNATLFLAKFFGRSDLLALIAAVPESQRPAMFRSLLFEACGRTVNPVNGAVGLLSTGNWKVCQDAVSTVLCGGTLQPLIPPVTPPGGGVDNNEETPIISAFNAGAKPQYLNLVAGSASPINSPPSSSRRRRGKRSHFTENNWQLKKPASSTCSEMSSEMLTVDSSNGGGTQEEMKLLNLFV